MKFVRHLRFQRHLDAWLDGQSTPGVDYLAVTHLDECPGCRGDLLLLLDMKGFLGVGRPAGAVS